MIKNYLSFIICTFAFNVLVNSQSTAWLLNGNTLNVPSNFLGTTNNLPVVFKTDNTERARLTGSGLLGVGIDAPKQILHVHDNSLIPLIDNPSDIPVTPALKSQTTYAYSAIQLTNNLTGINQNDGLQIFTKDSCAGIYLQEKGVFELKAENSSVVLYPDNKFSFFSPTMKDASVNIFSHSCNAVDIRILKTNNSQIDYALKIESNTQTHDFIKVEGQNQTVFRLNGKGEAHFGYGIERVSLGDTKGLGEKFATGYIGFNITRDDNKWLCKGDNANNGAVLIYGNIAGDLRILNIKTSGGSNSQLTDNEIGAQTSVFINRDGQVGIGTDELGPHYKLAVEGTIGTRRVKVTEVSFGADFVFCPQYELKPLSEVEAFVQKYRHLPDIPSEAQMQRNGLDLTEMNILLLQKIEELYLYVIELEKKINDISK